MPAYNVRICLHCEDMLVQMADAYHAEPRNALTKARVVPICWMWGRLACEATAQRDAPLAFVLLGDDTTVEPQG